MQRSQVSNAMDVPGNASPRLGKSANIESATRIFADAGPFVTYYIVSGLGSKTTGCFWAFGVGAAGFFMDFINSRVNRDLPWPRLLNSAEITVYLGMALLFFFDSQCSMW